MGSGSSKKKPSDEAPEDPKSDDLYPRPDDQNAEATGDTDTNVSLVVSRPNSQTPPPIEEPTQDSAKLVVPTEDEIEEQKEEKEQEEQQATAPKTEATKKEKKEKTLHEQIRNHQSGTPTFEESLKLIRPVIEALEAEPIMDSELCNGYSAFLQFYATRAHGVERFEKWLNELIQADIVAVTYRLWPKFMDPDVIQLAKTDRNNNAYWTWKWLLRILWNGSDASPVICKQMTKIGLLEEMIWMLNRPDFKPEKFSSDRVRGWTAGALIGCLHNCVRCETSGGRTRARKAGILDTMKKYQTSDVPLTVTKASIVIAHSANEEDMEMVQAGDDIIAMIVDELLRKALQNEDRRGLVQIATNPKTETNTTFSSRGFSVEEIVDALNALAIHDENKEKIFQAGILPLYAQIIATPANDDELENAVTGIWILSFTDYGRKAIGELKGYPEELRKIAKHENRLVRNAASGALLNFADKKDNGNNRSASDKDNKKSGASNKHVMISYDHDHKKIARYINKRLKESRYKTWIDEEQMKGSTLDAMAAAVENAYAVVMCWSERYQNSVNCRSEAEYAYKINSPIVPVKVADYSPTGWLNMLLASKYYVTCRSVPEVDDKLDELRRQIDGILEQTGHKPPPSNAATNNTTKPPRDSATTKKSEHHAKPKRPSSKSDHHSSRSSNSNSGALSKMSQTDVQDWLANVQLGHLGMHLRKFNGTHIQQLRDMHRQHPALFYENAKNFLGIGELADLLTLINEMEKL